jgi:endo-1,4-beta-xylanase
VNGLEFVGNITTNNAVDTDGKTFSKHWDQITPENAGKWGSVQSSAGAAFNWRTLDAIYDYAEANGVIFKQHTFIWGSQQPSGTISESQVRTWMREFCARYPNTKLIDVVNEPPPHTTPSYANNIGGGTNGSWQWIVNAFKWAREACPNATLILNDYNNIEWSNDTTRFIGIVKTIREAGAPIDAVGAQAHDLDHSQVSFNTVKSLLTRLSSETGLPVYVTEMDISTSNDASQLALYQQYIPLFLDAGVRGITIWGWIYGKTWSLAPESGLIRNGTARPAMTWLMSEFGRPAP